MGSCSRCWLTVLCFEQLPSLIGTTFTGIIVRISLSDNHSSNSDSRVLGESTNRRQIVTLGGSGSAIHRGLGESSQISPRPASEIELHPRRGTVGGLQEIRIHVERTTIEDEDLDEWNQDGKKRRLHGSEEA